MKLEEIKKEKKLSSVEVYGSHDGEEWFRLSTPNKNSWISKNRAKSALESSYRFSDFKYIKYFEASGILSLKEI